MTINPPDEDTSTVIVRALGVLAHNGQDSDARALLAGSQVLLPAAPDPIDDTDAEAADADATDADATHAEDALKLDLPLTGRTVQVFTSEARMAEVLPDVECYRLVPLGLLPAHWPDGGLSLTIDPGSPETLTLSVDGVRLLLGEQ
ncbi:SseB family protein [Streptomyces montanus]|uniref:SseB family protein n=1 Tax=Streptomyces montanus TaxID=2580423 RepID=A0A5R9FL68_9ACTN|nr:SseB family protein [Streptomyces montanus]TLS43309.1 SseB family protein [Streptomyces montanus]